MTAATPRVQEIMQAQHIPGLALAIQQNDRLLEEIYQGYANLEHSVPVTADTVFEIASVTKLFTTQAVLRLAQDKRLGLEDTLGMYLKDLPETWQRVTLQQCLTHQSGISGYTDVEAYWKVTRVDKSHEDVLALVRDLPLKFEPGSRYSYDNTGFYLLGMVIEAVSGQSYAEFLKQTIFDPLGMTHTTANDYAQIIAHRAQGYLYQSNGLLNKPFYSTSNTFSAGLLLSNIQDMLRWKESLFDESVLNAEYRRLWWTPHPSAEANERKEGFTLGLGWFRLDTPHGMFYGHSGGIPGFASTFLYFPDYELTGIVLCSAGRVGAPHEILLDVMKTIGVLK